MKSESVFAGVIGAAIGLIFLAVYSLVGVYEIDEGQRGIVTTHGEFQEVVGPGLHWKWPGFDGVQKVSIGVQELTLENLSTASKDNYDLGATVTLTYSLPGDKDGLRHIKANYPNYEARLKTIVSKHWKNAVGNYVMKDFAEQRSIIQEAALRQVRKVASEEMRINVVDFAVPYYSLSNSFKEARQKRKDAQTQLEVATRNQEKQQIEQQTLTNEAKSKAKRQQLKAQADAEARITRAEADAESRRLEGQAEADALRAKSKVLANSPNLVDYQRVLQWNGQVPRIMTGGNGSMLELKMDAGK